jgi:hypothetical protein
MGYRRTDTKVGFGGIVMIRLCAVPDVIVRVLGQVADALADLDALGDDVTPEARARPTGRVSEPQKQFDRGAFARAVRPQEPEDGVFCTFKSSGLRASTSL